MTSQHFLLFSDPLPEPTALLSADGEVIAGNLALRQRLGLELRDLEARPLASLVADAGEDVARYLQRCARSRSFVLGALALRDVNGNEIACRAEGCLIARADNGNSATLMLRLTPRASAAGQFIALNQRIDELGREVQRRRRAETMAREEEERLRVTLRSIGDGVIVTDANGAVMLMNSVAESLTNWAQLEAAGRPLDDVFRVVNETTRQPVANPALRALREGVIVGLANHSVLIAKDGRERPVDDSAAPIRDGAGQVIGSVLVFRDIAERRRAEAAVRESEARARQLADVMPQIVWTAGPNGQIDYLNRRWTDFTGLPQSVGNEAWAALLHPQDAGDARARWAASLAAGEPFEMPIRLLDRRHGTHRWHLVRTVAVKDDEGRVRRWFGTATDIHEQKRAEESARYLAEASAALAAVVDYESTLQKVASLAVPYFADWAAVDVADEGRLRRLAVAHQDPARIELVHQLMREYPADPDAPRGVAAVYRTGQPELMEEIPDELLERSVKDARQLQLIRSLGLRSYISVPLAGAGGATFGVLTFATAESGRRYTEADLRLAMDLAQRAGVAVENTRLYQALRENDRRKDEFLATLAHELRNPLAPIRNSLQILSMPRVDPETAARSRDMMARQLHHLVRLVDDLMDVSRVMQGKIELRRVRVELATVLARAAETVQPLIDAQGHRLSVQLPAESLAVDADPMRLAQVVGNLLTNAAKYTPREGRIWVTAERQGDVAVLRVRDTGIGLAADMRHRIFELFVQGEHAAAMAQGGLGIGLTLVKNLVEMHHGSVEAHSDGPGHGAEFELRLPLSVDPDDRETCELPDVSARTPPPTSGCRVLVVDDNRDAADSLGLVLRLHGHDVRVEYSGQAALDTATSYHPHVVFLDIGMPGLDGYEVARRIRREPGLERVVLAALTGWGQQEDRRRSAQAGFDRHLVKPVDPATLEAVLADVMRHRPSSGS